IAANVGAVRLARAAASLERSLRERGATSGSDLSPVEAAAAEFIRELARLRGSRPAAASTSRGEQLRAAPSGAWQRSGVP
ncbi:MAG: hypothetical protein KC486_36635, partial [Myxococcales bacterium]|nr:hypothetical protein [Myxococcales bacterium]